MRQFFSDVFHHTSGGSHFGSRLEVQCFALAGSESAVSPRSADAAAKRWRGAKGLRQRFAALAIAASSEELVAARSQRRASASRWRGAKELCPREALTQGWGSQQAARIADCREASRSQRGAKALVITGTSQRQKKQRSQCRAPAEPAIQLIGQQELASALMLSFLTCCRGLKLLAAPLCPAKRPPDLFHLRIV